MRNDAWRDFRTEPNTAKIQIRKLALKMFQSGQGILEVSHYLQVRVPTLKRWLSWVAHGGTKRLEGRKGTGRPPILQEKHLRWILATVRDKNPAQLRFEFAYWTAARVRTALWLQFKVTVGVRTMRRVLRRLGLTFQRPVFRSRRRKKGRVDEWVSTEFPAIRSQAREKSSAVLFLDEAGMRADYHSGSTWGVRGTTPVIEDTGQRFRCNMISAIGLDGELYFDVLEESCNARKFCEFLTRIRDACDGRIHVIVDNCSIHTAGYVRKFLESDLASEQIAVSYLPAYSPELNPVELIWGHVKRRVGQQIFRTREEMKSLLIQALERLQDDPGKVSCSYREAHLQYILR